MDAKSFISRGIATVTPIFAAFGGVLSGIAPPTSRSGQETNVAVGIASVGSLAILLFVVALARNWNLDRRKRVFLPISAFFFVLGLIGVMCFFYLMRHRVVAYPPEADEPIRYVVGTVYTTIAEKYVGRHPEVAENPVALLRKLGGDPAAVWTTESIETTRSWLVAAYIAVALLLAGTLICIAEGILVEPKQPLPESDAEDPSTTGEPPTTEK